MIEEDCKRFYDLIKRSSLDPASGLRKGLNKRVAMTTWGMDSELAVKAERRERTAQIELTQGEMEMLKEIF